MTIGRLVCLAAVAALTLAGCAGDTDGDGPGAGASGTPAATASAASGTAGVPAAAAPLLAEHGLTGKDPVQIIEHLDRLGGDDRPDDLMASVRVDQLLLTAGDQEHALDLPDDRFYLSVAPYVDRTHDCFYHSLTTCQGELVGEEVGVQITDAAGTTLVDETRTTFENGFTGFWLPRDLRGTLRVTYGDKSGEVDIATDAEAPTCLTTLKLI